MVTTFILLALYLSAVAAAPAYPQRIVGGSQTTIGSYPSISSLISHERGFWGHKCGGTIVSQRAIVTAAHCVMDDRPSDWRIRVGSTSSAVGGAIYNCDIIIINPLFVRSTRDNDAAILRPTGNILMGAAIRSAPYASQHYNLPDNSVVWAAGWGATSNGGSNVVNLRHVQVWTINSVTCMQRYASMRVVTANMLCSGWLNVGGRDQCQGDSGGPLYHNGILVGIASWGEGCGHPFFPGVNTRVSRISSWIANNL